MSDIPPSQTMAQPSKEIDELLKAINALEDQRLSLGDSVVDAALAPLHEQLKRLELVQPESRHRRYVTMLFMDIANSTQVSQGREPEEVLEMVGGVLKRLSTPIIAHGGQVTQYMGDGFVAAFGLIQVHENDARQAVRAGLAILAESRACAIDLQQRYHLQGFNIRIGINTGRVVAGRFTEAESTVMGLTVPLAARLEQEAQVGELLISQFTYQHVRGAFDVEPLKPIEAKGFPDPVEVYRVLASRPRTFKTFTRGVEGAETGLIGREAELLQLQQACNHAINAQETMLVTVTGDAGVGKSRLLYEFDRWLARSNSRITAFKARASPQLTAVPYGMLRDMFSYHLDLLTTDTAQVTRMKLENELSANIDDEPQMKAHFIGSLLGFDLTDSPYLQGVENDPRQLRQRALVYSTQYFNTLANKAPVVVMLDDTHWADAPSVSFLNRLVEEYPHLPLFVICLSRPELAERFPDLCKTGADRDQPLFGVTAPPLRIHLGLQPLTRQASEQLLAEILCNVETLPVSMHQHILDWADGNPFYLEEFIQSLIDTGILRQGEQGSTWKLDAERLGALELPATLTALLEARLDNLNTAQRMLLQQASVIGHFFWRSALQAVHGTSPIADEELKLLCRRGFLFQQEASDFSGTEEYRFHHALLRDVAYNALLKSDRQACHERAAAWLVTETDHTGRSGEFAPMIASHYEYAGKPSQAADWFTQAGKKAHKQGEPAQARGLFDRALAQLGDNLDEPEHYRKQRWEALAGRDAVLGILGDISARMADDRLLISLAEKMGDQSLQAEAWYRHGHTLEGRGRYSEALEAYNRGLAAARLAGDLPHEALILGLMVICEVRAGDLKAAREISGKALAVAEQVGDDNILVRNLTNVSSYYTDMGDLARALQLIKRQLEINRRMGNIEGELAGLSSQGYIFIISGMLKEGIADLQHCIDLAETIKHRPFLAYGRLNLALGYFRHGDFSSAAEELDQCLLELKAMNDAFGYGVGQTYLGLVMEQQERVEEARHCYEQAAEDLSKIEALPNQHDAEAGVARCVLKLGDLPAARKHADSVWNYLNQHAGAGMEFPVLAFLTCADIFEAAGQPAIAKHAIGAGYGELLLRAGRISLPEWCQSFLEQVPEHRRIRERWQEYINSNLE